MSRFGIVLVIFLIGCGADRVNLVQPGESSFGIDLEGADSLATVAAGQLQSYIHQVTGYTIPMEKKGERNIRFLVDSQLPNGGIGYRVEGKDLVFYGQQSAQLLDAVYEFLEREIGVRFYSPEVEHIPKKDKLSLPASLDFLYSPPITTRTVHSRLFYEHAHFAKKLHVSEESFPTYVPEAKVHTFHRFMPADDYFDAHPEYYALRNGRRLPTQLCLTNASVFEIVREKVAALIEQYPDAAVLSVSQDDNTLYCQCDSCEAIHQEEGSAAGSMIHFVNRIAREFPEKTISTLAYQYTRKAPATVRPEPNVLITLCSIECDRSAPIEDTCKDFAADLKEWSAITENVRIWDYTTQFTNYLAPFPNIHTLKPNIELFVANNAKWVFEQHSHHPSSLFELRSYLTAKLLWNPQSDTDSLIQDFAQGYYKEAAPFIVDYVKSLEEEIGKVPDFFLFLYGDPAQGFPHFLSKDNLKKYNALFDQAVEAVGDDEELVRRVHAARIGVDFASMEFAKTEMRSLSEADKDALDARIDRFREVTDRGTITLMNEMGLKVSEYLEGYGAIVNRAAKPNVALHKPVQLNTKATKYADENPAVLTDGAYGGTSFYANWLGFLEDCEAIVDVEKPTAVNELEAAFLQVVNHVVFFPPEVEFYGSLDGNSYRLLGRVRNATPLNRESKTSAIQNYTLSNLGGESIRYIKIRAKNFGPAPMWHHAAGNPSWIFVDELEIR